MIRPAGEVVISMRPVACPPSPARRSRGNRSHREAGRGPGPFRHALSQTGNGTPEGMTACWLSATTATPGSIADEFQCQPGHGKGCEKDRQEPLAGAPERDDLVLGGIEGLGAAGVPPITDLQGVTSRLE